MSSERSELPTVTSTEVARPGPTSCLRNRVSRPSSSSMHEPVGRRPTAATLCIGSWGVEYFRRHGYSFSDFLDIARFSRANITP
ncbi:hypothetical protein C8Q77DRAFT_1142479 [Trametes polyzona]|nr:hypothetical protein C8Q77DRAFT_1142479 [Trametes polyzona]